jgi:uncharacterized protein (DUF1697 family)
MPSHLVFLRAINLGPTRKFPKDDIIRTTAAAGFDDVRTHINTGNVRVTSNARSRRTVESKLEAAYAADRGFDVPCIAFTVAEFVEVAAYASELSEAHPGLARHYVYLLKEELAPEQVEAVEATASDAGRMVVRGRAAHALLEPGYEGGTVDPLKAAKLLGVGTNRNLNVVQTLAQKWCGAGS